jgi:hypothetical protein
MMPRFSFIAFAPRSGWNIRKGQVATPGAIRYRDLTNGIEGVLLSVYVRRAKQHQHSENQHLENLNAMAAQSM